MARMNLLDIGDEYADYLHDESRREGHAEKITFPKSTEEVREALRIAAKNNWPITVQGGRTGITGGCVPDGGLILNLSRMNTTGEIEGDRMTVQPGATLADIRAAIRDSGLFFPSDLTETTASIGGMAANNASGARSFHYGSVRNWIDALEVVLPRGEVVRVKRGVHTASGVDFQLGSLSGKLPANPQLMKCWRFRQTPHTCAGVNSHLRRCAEEVKNAAGYYLKPDMDLVDLFIGAEGTLGVVTGITIRLLPKPERINGLTAFFASEEEALDFVRFLRSAGSDTRPTAIEFFDFCSLELLRRMKTENAAFADLPKLKPEFHTAIYFEYDDDVPDAVVEKVDGAIDCWIAEGEHEIETLKNFRHAIPEAVNMLIGERKKTIPELTKLGTDMSVPDPELENVMQMYHEDLAAAGLEYVIFGHIGNNHVHVNILPRSMEEHEEGKALYLDWAKQVVAMGGSVSAEHGIGKIKIDFLKLMYGTEGIREMRKLKKRFDPRGLLNPGNLFR
ncbi:MAG: FAD-binding oxidoreductase [Verrucomicrobia bacterium]|nr:MAG: FAD-binding oxidoreductase [Verrucomicrobiota bacterium]